MTREYSQQRGRTLRYQARGAEVEGGKRNGKLFCTCHDPASTRAQRPMPAEQLHRRTTAPCQGTGWGWGDGPFRGEISRFWGGVVTDVVIAVFWWHLSCPAFPALYPASLFSGRSLSTGRGLSTVARADWTLSVHSGIVCRAHGRSRLSPGLERSQLWRVCSG